MKATREIDLNLVAVFVRVVEAGSFTAAATALGLPKSSVSRAVSRLEDSLGVRLLQRTTRRLGLTQAGDRYLATVREPIARLAEASSETSDLGQQPRGLVRISIAPQHEDGTIAELLVDFVARYPQIRVDLVVTNRRVNLVAEGIDLALRAGKLDDSTLVARKLAVAELGLYAAPAYLAKKGHPRRLADLAAHACVLHRSARGILPWRLTGPKGTEQVSVTGPITADDLWSVRLLTIAGLGVALMPDMAVWPDLASGRLVRVLPRYALRGAALHLVSPPLRHVPARVMLLRDHLVRGLIGRLADTPCAVDPQPTQSASARVPALASART
jgi:DNA-binding transcriptional LysR family regulator